MDSGALLGIAVTAADTTNGSWYYSTNNGTNWNALGAVASNNARLLAADANTRLYFQPNANYHGTLATAITFRAWDQTSGGNGTLADTTSNGGTTAFSTATDTASLVINPVADTPSVTNATTNEDTQTTSGLVISRNAADGAEVTHFKITGITNGTLYQNDGTTQISNGTFITFAEGNAGLKFTPTANFNGSGSFTIQASTSNGDAGLGGSTVVATITVNAVNDAPVLDNTKSPALSAINEDAGAPSGAVGTLVSAWWTSLRPPDRWITSPTWTAGRCWASPSRRPTRRNGTWYYSTDNGTNWNALGAVASNNARLLAADANTRLYFQPNADYSGTLASAITFRAWDQTSGTSGTLADTTSNGGTTAFSTATDTASLTVTAVNDAPVLDNTQEPGARRRRTKTRAHRPAPWARWSRAWWTSLRPRGRWTTSASVDSGALLGIAVTAADTTNGTWYYSTNNGTNWNALGAVADNNARLLAADANTRLYFQPNANYHGTLATAITFRAWDQTSGGNGTLADTTSNGGTTAFSHGHRHRQPGDQPGGRHAVGDQRHDQRGHADDQRAGDLAQRRRRRRGDALQDHRDQQRHALPERRHDADHQRHVHHLRPGQCRAEVHAHGEFQRQRQLHGPGLDLQRRRRPGRQYGGRDHYGHCGQRRPGVG